MQYSVDFPFRQSLPPAFGEGQFRIGIGKKNRRLLPWGPVLLLLLSCSALAGGGGTNALSQDDGENSLPPLGNPPFPSPGSWTCNGECWFRSGNMDHAETATAEYTVSADGRQILRIDILCTEAFEYKADFSSNPLYISRLANQDGMLTYEDKENEGRFLGYACEA